jgi:hypothetical protein
MSYKEMCYDARSRERKIIPVYILGKLTGKAELTHQHVNTTRPLEFGSFTDVPEAFTKTMWYRIHALRISSISLEFIFKKAKKVYPNTRYINSLAEIFQRKRREREGKRSEAGREGETENDGTDKCNYVYVIIIWENGGRR